MDTNLEGLGQNDVKKMAGEKETICNSHRQVDSELGYTTHLNSAEICHTRHI